MSFASMGRWWLAMGLAGCGGTSDASPPSAATPNAATTSAATTSNDATKAPLACGPAQAKEISELLLASCSSLPFQDARPLPLARWKPTHTGAVRGLPVEIGTKGMSLHGAPPPMPEGMWELSRELERSNRTFVLAIHGDVTLAEVQPVLAELHGAGATRGVLLFASGTEPHTPRAAHPEIHARLSAKIEYSSPAERAMAIARELETLIAPCSTIQQAFRGIAVADPIERCPTLATAIGKGIVTCGCPSWAPELVSWMQVMGGPADAPRMHVDTIELSPGAPTQAAPTTTWSSFVGERTAPLGSLWLELAP